MVRTGGDIRREQELADIEAAKVEAIEVVHPQEYTAVRVSLDTTGIPSIMWRKESEGSHRVKLVDCLRPFLRLADASDEAIFHFTEIWGVLGVEIDVEHEHEVIEDDVFSGGGDVIYRESIEKIRGYALLMKNILARAAAIRAFYLRNQEGYRMESVVHKDLWDSTAPITKREYIDPVSPGSALVSEKGRIAMETSMLLEKAQAKPIVRVGPEGKMRITMKAGASFDVDNDSGWVVFSGFGVAPSALFSAIVFELIAVLTSETGVYLCNVCGNPFPSLSRALRDDRKKFCTDECRAEARKVTERNSKRKRRLEMKAMRSNADQNVPVATDADLAAAELAYLEHRASKERKGGAKG